MNIDTLVESFYSKIDENEDLINEVMRFFLVEEEKSAEEPKPRSPSKERRDRALRFPLLVPSEQSVGQYTAEGSEDRATFELWMKKIAPQGNLEEKIASLQAFIDSPPKDMPIATTLSYLMFLQTFSYMIREFNASVAGFLWEPFLAAMFGGKSTQVHTKEGDIADVKLEYSILVALPGSDGLQRVSLKILSPTGSVGGSFVDLVNHFCVNPKQPMTYVVIRKMPGVDKGGEKIKEATMAFWEFSISQETFFTWIGPPKVSIQKETRPYTHPEDGAPDWGRKELATALEKSDFVPDGWYIIRVDKAPKKLAGTKPGSIVPGQTYEIQMRSTDTEPGKEGVSGSGNAAKIWGSDELYAQWYALWEEMAGNPEFWQRVRGPKALRTGPDDPIGSPLLDGPDFAELGALGYQKSAQFKIDSTYQKKKLETPMGTINILPSVLDEAFQQGAELIGPQLTEMFNALSALIDNVGRFFLIDCGDPQGAAETCDEKDSSMRQASGRDAIKDAAKLKEVVDLRIAPALKPDEE